MGEVRTSKFFADKITQRKACQPFFGQRLCFRFFSKRVEHRYQFFRSAQIFGSEFQAFCQ